MGSILDDLIMAYDKDPTSRQIAEKPLTALGALEIREVREVIHKEEAYQRRRARSKQGRDLQHLKMHEERQRIFQEAYRDVLGSPGEVDSQSSSTILGIEVDGKFEGIEPGDVLIDPKLRTLSNGYTHDALLR